MNESTIGNLWMGDLQDFHPTKSNEGLYDVIVASAILHPIIMHHSTAQRYCIHGVTHWTSPNSEIMFIQSEEK